jgi:hypothetical protein
MADGRRSRIFSLTLQDVRLRLCRCVLSGLMKRVGQFGCTKYICDAFETVNHRRESDFYPRTRQPASANADAPKIRYVYGFSTGAVAQPHYFRATRSCIRFKAAQFSEQVPWTPPKPCIRCSDLCVLTQQPLVARADIGIGASFIAKVQAPKQATHSPATYQWFEKAARHSEDEKKLSTVLFKLIPRTCPSATASVSQRE